MPKKKFEKIDESTEVSFLRSNNYGHKVKIEYLNHVLADKSLDFKNYKLNGILLELQKKVDWSKVFQFGMAQTEDEMDKTLLDNYDLKPDYKGYDMKQNGERYYDTHIRLIDWIKNELNDSNQFTDKARIKSSLYASEFAFFFKKLYDSGWVGSEESGKELPLKRFALLLTNAFEIKTDKGSILSSDGLYDLMRKDKINVNEKFKVHINQLIQPIEKIEATRKNSNHDIKTGGE